MKSKEDEGYDEGREIERRVISSQKDVLHFIEANRQAINSKQPFVVFVEQKE